MMVDDENYSSEAKTLAQGESERLGSVPRVISRGAQGGRVLLAKFFIILEELSPPKNSCIGLAFQSLLTLLPKCFLLLYSITYCYVAIETFLIVDYTISVLN